MTPKIEGFENLELFGRGGFGVVYRAWQPEFGRPVALKVLAASVDEAAQRRAASEALAMGSLSGHPNIVAIHSSGTTSDGEPYFVMPWLAAGSLGDRIETRGPHPWDEVVPWTIKLAGALQTAHASGILHRDVKPDNVLFSDFGEPQLADFGIARITGAGETSGELVTTTILYAAPEILAGAPPSASADVYALAATAYAAVVGRPAFTPQPEEPLASTIARVASQPLPRPPDVFPDPIWAVLSRAMAKETEDRPASASEFGGALQRAQRMCGQPISAMTVPRSGPSSGLDTVVTEAELPPRSVQTVTLAEGGQLPLSPGHAQGGRRKWPVAALGVAALLLAAGGAAYLLLRSDRSPSATVLPTTTIARPIPPTGATTSTTSKPTTTTAPTTTTSSPPESQLISEFADPDPSHWAPSSAQPEETFQQRVFNPNPILTDYPVNMNGCGIYQTEVHWRSLRGDVRPAIAGFWQPQMGGTAEIQAVGDPASEGTMTMTNCEQPAFIPLEPSTLADVIVRATFLEPAI